MVKNMKSNIKKSEKTLDKHKNNIGKTFNRLTVLDVLLHKTKRGENIIYYKCLCECGNIIETYSLNVLNNKTTSCGCFRNEQIRKANYIGNKYEIRENYAIGYTTKNEKFYIDKEDLEKIKPYTWSLNAAGYLRANIKRKYYRMHRYLLGLDDDDKEIMVDHINHNTLDNRRANLRIVSPAQNAKNVSISISNTSGTTGVSWNKRSEKWEAYIRVNKKRKFLGYYKDINDAIKARKDAEQKYYKEYSYDNSILLSPILTE